MVLIEQEKQQYVDICTFLGGFTDLIQGSGGNFSVKNGNEIMIKSSGKRIIETTITEGYVVCDIVKLRDLYLEHNNNTISTVISGDTNTSPSMEVFFHLIPKKWIIHLHPTFILKKLCTTAWKSYTSNPKYLTIPYIMPGIDLSIAICSQYKNEEIILLQNHGIILCGDSLKEILYLLDNLTEEFASCRINYAKMFEFLCSIRSTGKPCYLKPCTHIKYYNHRYFFQLTPDISLFLKTYPMSQETHDQDIYNLWVKYTEATHTMPSVIVTPGMVYVLGISYKHCICIEEIFESYISICDSIHTNDINILNTNNTESLNSSTQELYRINSL